jgi:hypothetical protein
MVPTPALDRIANAGFSPLSSSRDDSPFTFTGKIDRLTIALDPRQ